VKSLKTLWLERFGSVKARMVHCIELQGWNTTMIQSEDGEPEYAFTTGLWASYAHPELMMIGLPRQIAAKVLHGLSWKIREGERRFEPGGPYLHVLQDYPVYATAIDDQFQAAYLGGSVWYYYGHLGRKDSFPTLQLVWPDRESGAFPWDAGWPEHYVGLQPLLGPIPPLTTIH